MSTCNDCANSSYCKLPSKGVCNPAEDCKMFTRKPKPRIFKPSEYEPMTKDDIHALKRIRKQLDFDYIHFAGYIDEDEIRLIKKALDEYEKNHKGEEQ